MITRWSFGKKNDGKMARYYHPSTLRSWPGPVQGDGIGFGVLKGGEDCFRATLNAGHHYIYADNSYFLAQKSRQIRLAVDNYWHISGEDREADLEAAGCVIQPWSQGDAVLVAPHSQIWHEVAYGENRDKWLNDTIATLKQHTDRPIIYRKKPGGGHIPGLVDNMVQAFKSAWAVVTAGSTIGVEAVCRGVPVFNTRQCASSPMALHDLSKIESPLLPDEDERRAWAMNLAARQFGQKELESGKAHAVMKEDIHGVRLQAKMVSV